MNDLLGYLVAPAAEKAHRAEGDKRDRSGFGDGDEFVDDAAGAVGGGVGDEGVEFAELVLAEAVDGEAEGDLVIDELGDEEFADGSFLEVGVEEPAVHAWAAADGEVAEDVLADELGDGGAAVDEAAGDGDSVLVVVLKGSAGAGDGVDKSCG